MTPLGLLAVALAIVIGGVLALRLHPFVVLIAAAFAVALLAPREAGAEVSALLNMPLGVARILVADLAEAGLVAVHQPGGDETTGAPDVTLLERVLSGLRKL